MKIFLEYVWLDGYKPSNLRSKTKVLDLPKDVKELSNKIDGLPMWSFDGSSTKQAEGTDSDCLLKPVIWWMTLLEVNHIKLSYVKF